MKVNVKKTFRTVFYVLTTIVLLFSIGCPGASSGTTTTDDSASDVKIIPSAVFSTTDVQAVINAQSVINRSINRASGGGILEVNTVGKLLMPLFTGIKQNTTNYEVNDEADGSVTIKDHFGYYMNHPVLLNVKSSSSGTVIKYYQDVDDNLQKSEGDNNVGTVTATYYAPDVSANGEWTFSQTLADQLGTYKFELEGTGSYSSNTFIGSGSFAIETMINSLTDGYTGSADTEWTQSGQYKRVFVRNGRINPKSTTLSSFFKVTGLEITTEINLTTNVVTVTENNTTEEYLNEDSINKRKVTTKNIVSTNDADGNVISSTYNITVIEYDSNGTYQDTSDDTIIVAEKTYEGTIDPTATTTTNPNATTTTITGTTNPGDTTTSTTLESTTTTSTTIASNLPAPYAYYSFDNDFTDVSSNTNDLTNNGNVSISSTIYKKIKSANFSGTSGDYLYKDAFLQPDSITGLTYTGWIRYTSGSERGIMSLKSGSSYLQYYLRINSYGKLAGYIGNNEAVSSANVASSTWTHIAAVWSLDYNSNQYSLTLYINGVKDGEKILTTAPSNSSVLERICIGYNGYYVMAGNMDEVRIYDKALTAAEIAADMALSQ